VPTENIFDIEEQIAEVARELAALELDIQRRSFLADPVLWGETKLGDTYWSGQRKILQSLRDHRKTAVYTCHEVGKTRIAAVAAGWWLDNHPAGEAFVVTTAPTAYQVRSVLWREINRVHSRGNLSGRTNQTEWLMVVPGGKEEQVAIGRKPDEYQQGSFQGIHQKYLLFILDEACGVPLQLWVEGESLVANDFSKVLAIGNPDDPTTEFGRICKPGSDYNVIQIGAFDTPNFTGEDVPQSLKDNLIGFRYVEDMRKRWARTWTWSEDRTELLPPVGADPKSTNPFFQSKVLGQFPQHSTENGLIPLQWILEAQQRTLKPFGPNELGVDVGGGGDSSTICHRRGGVYRIVHEDTNPDTMQTTGAVIDVLQKTGATLAKIDMIGIGRGVVDRGKELKQPFVGVNVGTKATYGEDDNTYEAQEERKRLGIGFANLRSQLYWNLRTMFETGTIDIDLLDEQLAAELVEIRYKRRSNGTILIESKEDMLRRGVPSPNRADALMLAASEIQDETPSLSPVWGSRRI
jgi:hypothetical protein